jgi:hypothetical protein
MQFLWVGSGPILIVLGGLCAFAIFKRRAALPLIGYACALIIALWGAWWGYAVFRGCC